MYFVFHVWKLKSSEVAPLGRHNERNENSKIASHANGDIDPEKTKMNYNLVGNIQGTMLQRCKKRIEESGCETRITKASVFIVEVVVSASPEWFATADERRKKLYFEQAYKYFQDKYGKENIISAAVHFDETTPHMHIDIVPLVKAEDKIKLSAKDLVGGKFGLIQWHTDFATYMQAHGFNELSRGENTSGVKHKTVEEYKAENAKRYKEQKRFKGELIEKLKPHGVLASLLKECRLSKEEAGHLLDLLTSQDDYIAKLEKDNHSLAVEVESLERKYHNEHMKTYSLPREMKKMEEDFQKRISEIVSKNTDEYNKLLLEKIDIEKSYDELNSKYQKVYMQNEKFKELCVLAEDAYGSVGKFREALEKEIMRKEAIRQNAKREQLSHKKVKSNDDYTQS